MSNTIVEHLRNIGASVDWYDKANRLSAEPAKPRQFKDPKICNFLSARYCEYADGRAKVYTVHPHNGSKYLCVRNELTKKTGSPVWWCTACEKIYHSWEEYLKHMEKNDGKAQSKVESVQGQSGRVPVDAGSGK